MTSNKNDTNDGHDQDDQNDNNDDNDNNDYDYNGNNHIYNTKCNMQYNIYIYIYIYIYVVFKKLYMVVYVPGIWVIMIVIVITGINKMIGYGQDIMGITCERFR